MNESLDSTEQLIKGMDLAECVERADVYIQRNGACLLVLDVIESRNYPDRRKLYADYSQLLADLNVEFEDYLLENKLTHEKREEKGFNLILGDGATGAINDSSIISKVMDYVAQHPTALQLRFAVAENGYDNVGMSLIK